MKKVCLSGGLGRFSNFLHKNLFSQETTQNIRKCFSEIFLNVSARSKKHYSLQFYKFAVYTVYVCNIHYICVLCVDTDLIRIAKSTMFCTYCVIPPQLCTGPGGTVRLGGPVPRLQGGG